jgi:hypothetical protein
MTISYSLFNLLLNNPIASYIIALEIAFNIASIYLHNHHFDRFWPSVHQHILILHCSELI